MVFTNPPDGLDMANQDTSHAPSIAVHGGESPPLGPNGGFLAAILECLLRSPPAVQRFALKEFLKSLEKLLMPFLRRYRKRNTGSSTSSVQDLLELNLQENLEESPREKGELQILIPNIKAIVITSLQSSSSSNRAINEGDRRGGFDKQNVFFSFLPNGGLSFCLLLPDVSIRIVFQDIPQQRPLSLAGPDSARDEGDEASQAPNHDANEVRSINEPTIDLNAVRRAIMDEVKHGGSTGLKATTLQLLGDVDSCITEPSQNEDEQSRLQVQTDQDLEEETRASSDTEDTCRLPQQGQVDDTGLTAILGPQSDPHPAAPCGLNVGNQHTQAARGADPRTSRAGAKKKRRGMAENTRVSPPEDEIRSRARTSVPPSTPVQCTEDSKLPFSSQPSRLLAAGSRPPPESPLHQVAVIKESLMGVQGGIQDLLYRLRGRPPGAVQVPVQEHGPTQNRGDLHLRRGGVQATGTRRGHGRVRSHAPSDPLRQDTLLDVVAPRYLPPPQSFLWQVEDQSEMCPSAWVTLQPGSTIPGCT